MYDDLMHMPQSIIDAIPSCQILIVDDDEMIRQFIEIMLEGHGFQNIHHAENGWEALEVIKTQRLDCVILDINMPGMSGRDVLRHVRNGSTTHDLPVLVITAHDDREERNQILNFGASNLISKPIDQDLLLKRLNSLLERKLMIEKLSSYHQRLSQELEQASQMQKGLIPTAQAIDQIEEQYGVKLAHVFKPSSELGGDYWTTQAIDEHRFGIMIADFSGHGVSAALNTFQLNTVMSRVGICQTDPATYLGSINDRLVDVIPRGQYCTMLYALVDIENDTITYAAAASPPPIYGTSVEGPVHIGDGSGVPLGIKTNNTYKNRHIDLKPGQFAFFFSDVLYETELAGTDMLEIDGLATFARHHSGPDAHKALDQFLATFYDNAPSPLPDDLTAIWLTR